MQAIRAVIFDWDGTLADTFEATRHASISVFRHFGVRMDERRYRATYQPDWHATYRDVGIPEDRWGEANGVWQRRYRERVERVGLFPGVMDLLRTLEAAGLGLGVVSAADRERLGNDLRRFGLQGRFGAVVAFEDATWKKPHPDGLLRALRELGRRPEEAAYVGDRPEDVLMGRRAGTRTIAVPSAYGRETLLREARPDRLVASVSDVPAALNVPSAPRS